MIIQNLIYFLIWLAVLTVSGAVLVKSLSIIARFLKIGEYVAGFIILAFATSVPELFVGVASAFQQKTAIALGTIIGSNIADLTIIIGIPLVLAKGLRIKSKATKKDCMYMIFLSALPLVLMLLGGEISRMDGAILIAAFAAYEAYIYRTGKEFSKKIENNVTRHNIVIYSALFVVGLLLLFKSSEMVVFYANALAIDIAIPPIIIGLLLVALGTSLPELAVSTTAALKGHPDMSLGNITGSVIANSTLILGITSLIFPITSNFLLFITSGIYMLTITVIFTAFVQSGNKLDRVEGISLILLYVFFVIMQIYIRGTL